MGRRRGGGSRRRRVEWNPIWRRGAAAAQAGGGDPDFANVSLLLPFNGADTATTTTDESNSGHTITFTGNAQLDTAIKKFGTASALFDGLGGNLGLPNHADFQLGSGDFTLECHADFDTTGVDQTLMSRWNGSGNYSWLFDRTSAGQLRFVYSLDGTAFTIVDEAWTPTLNQFYHLAVTREGANIRIFVDGTQLGTTDTTISTSTIYAGGTVTPRIGAWATSSGAFDGSIDNVRITKGVARYTANFVAPTDEYPTS